MRTLIAGISITALIAVVFACAVLGLATHGAQKELLGRPPAEPAPVQLSFDDSSNELIWISNNVHNIYIYGTNATFRGYSIVLNTDHIMRVVDEELAGARSNILRRLSE